MTCECRKYMYNIYCSIKRKLAKGLWYARSWYALGTVRSLHTLYCAVLHVAALRKCRTFVHYYCSVEMFIKNLILPILLFLVKCTAHFACIIAYFFSLPILLKILLANFVKAYSYWITFAVLQVGPTYSLDFQALSLQAYKL